MEKKDNSNIEYLNFTNHFNGKEKDSSKKKEEFLKTTRFENNR